MCIRDRARLPALVPALRLRPVKALRPVHRVGGELVAEAVGEPQLVEHGGNIEMCIRDRGKAKKLKNRVSQYFQDSASHTAKTRNMVSQVDLSLIHI